MSDTCQILSELVSVFALQIALDICHQLVKTKRKVRLSFRWLARNDLRLEVIVDLLID